MKIRGHHTTYIHVTILPHNRRGSYLHGTLRIICCSADLEVIYFRFATVNFAKDKQLKNTQLG